MELNQRIRSGIRSIIKSSNEYDQKYIKIKFWFRSNQIKIDSGDNLTIDKIMKIFKCLWK